MPLTHVQETCTRNLCKSSCTKNYTCVGQSCTSFFLYNFVAVEHSSVPEQKLSGTWLESCNVIGRPVVVVPETDELRQIYSCKFLVQVSWPCVAGKVLKPKFGWRTACDIFLSAVDRTHCSSIWIWQLIVTQLSPPPVMETKRVLLWNHSLVMLLL